MSEIDRLLHEDRDEPSVGFDARVMRAVQARSTRPAPIPFPWRRLAVCVGGGTVALGFVATRGASDPFASWEVALALWVTLSVVAAAWTANSSEA